MISAEDFDDELRGGAVPPPDKDGTRLVWAGISILALIVLAYAGWLGIAVTGLQEQVASLTAKVDIALTERRP